jgi:hypothetical protein
MAEAEFGDFFVDVKEGTVTRTTLSEMGQRQDTTELKTDNTTADGITMTHSNKSAPNKWT